ncbi:MAG: transglutaminase domain-containing protein [Acidobacteria bacterium]|nr:transglutaminase domain-containing protein [Acidobacteriota bacterium]
MLILIFFTVFFYSFPGTAGGVIGLQSATYRFAPATSLPSYKNAGYEISQSGNGLIRVAVNAGPLKNNTLYPVQIQNKSARDVLRSNRVQPFPPSLPEIARRIVRPCHGYFQAVTALLNWVSRHFSYRLKGRTPLTGDCTAAAVLTVQLLSLAGIPARKATGVVVNGKQRVLSGKALHSFVEIYYPGTGWLFSDPLASHHFIPATYVLLHDASASNYFGLTLKCVKEPKPLRPVITKDRSGIPGRVNLFRFN